MHYTVDPDSHFIFPSGSRTGNQDGKVKKQQHKKCKEILIFEVLYIKKLKENLDQLAVWFLLYTYVDN